MVLKLIIVHEYVEKYFLFVFRYDLATVPVQGLGGQVFLMHLTFNYCQTYFTTPTVSITYVFVLIIYEHINDRSRNHLIMYVLITINGLMSIVVNASQPRYLWYCVVHAIIVLLVACGRWIVFGRAGVDLFKAS